MTSVAQAVVPIRSAIAALISRFAPKYYKEIIERRHAGVRVISDPSSDVRTLKDQILDNVLHTIAELNLPLLARIDDRNCWILLIGTGTDATSAERLAVELLDRGLRVNIAIRGGRVKRIRHKEHFERLRSRGSIHITSLRAGFVWMRARGFRQIGWHAATRIHLYDWSATKSTYCAREAGSLPPMIDKQAPGRESTITGLSSTETRLDKVRFPIDVVYTWVDGNDHVWNSKRNVHAAELQHGLHKVANSQTRYTNRDELRYSLRSLYYYAPWVRQVYVVTDDQVPDWYDPNCSTLTIVDHRDLFPDKDCLPTFNSHAIESVLHRIPNLSEHFLYMNDDVFFSSVVHPEAFFEVNGIARTFLSRAMIPFCNKEFSDIASEWGVINANELLREAYGAIMPYKTKHTPLALRRSLLMSLEDRFSQHFTQLRKKRFRTIDDLAPTSSLHAYVGISEGLVVRGDINYRYLNLARPDLEHALQRIAYSTHSMVYCLNDTEIADQDEFDWTTQAKVVSDFLQMMYPYQAPWEKFDSSSRER